MAVTYVETGNSTSLITRLAQVTISKKAGEYFWFSLCLVLFIILGPFSAPIALGFLFSQHTRNESLPEPECLNECGYLSR